MSLWSILMGGDEITIRVRKESHLAFLLSAFLGAYNRRTDVMERAVKLDERVQAVIHKLDTAGESLKDAVEANQPR
jgi:hypothetical protein